MRSMRPDPAIRVRRLRIPTAQGSIPALVLSPKAAPENAPGILWLHGGGYVAGMKEMVHMSRAVELVKRFGAVVLSPGYRLALQAPYPAAMDDCYAALLYLRSHAAALGVRSDQLMVGGESAGGGLCAAVCIRARDEGTVNVAFQMPLYPMLDDRDTETSRDNHGRGWNTRRDQLMVGGESAGGGLCAAVCIRARDEGTVNVAFQMPLYPMLDDRDTETSRDNHGRGWNTRRNHLAWRRYLRGRDRADLPPYAAPARLTDFSGLPPAYSFVGDGEPFYAETVRYFAQLRAAGIPAALDIYHTDLHAFDMMQPKTALSQQAAAAFDRHFAWALAHCFAPQKTEKGA